MFHPIISPLIFAGFGHKISWVEVVEVFFL